MAAAAGSGWAAACEKFRSARTLSAVESRKDPETEPYRSKYSARALLQEVKQQLSAAEDCCEARLLAVRRAVLEYELGVNHTDTEELSAGEEHLQRCTQLLEPHRLSRDCVSLYIQAQVGGGCGAGAARGGFGWRSDPSEPRNGPLLGAAGLAEVRHSGRRLVCDLTAVPSLLLAAQVKLRDAHVLSLKRKEKTLKNVITSFSECSCGDLCLTTAAVHLYARTHMLSLK